jgi:hypothetical protein
MPNQTNHFKAFLDRGGFAEGGVSCRGVSGVMEDEDSYCQKTTRSLLLLELG